MTYDPFLDPPRVIPDPPAPVVVFVAVLGLVGAVAFGIGAAVTELVIRHRRAHS